MKVLDYDGLEYYNSLVEDKYAPKTQLNNYLPLSGGTMTGSIVFGNGIVKKETDDDVLGLYGSTTYGNGATFQAFGKEHTNYAGWFSISANNGVNNKILIGKPDGTLTWDGTAISLNGHTHSYLPLSGGTMTGTIKRNGDVIVADNDQYTRVNGGSNSTSGASLTLGGKNHSWAGKWELKAHDGTNSQTLAGTAAGTLTWGGTAISLSGHTHSYLPLSGGTMTGEIKRNGTAISGTANSASVNIYGGTDNTSPYITLYGKSHSSYAGRITLRTGDGTNNPAVILYPNGTATWNGNNILTDATVGSYLSKDLTSSVSLSASTAKTIISMSLPAGKWIVKGFVRYTSVTASKIYGAQITNSGNSFSYGSSAGMTVHSSNTGTLSVQTTHIWNQSSTANIYLCGYGTAACTAENAVIQAIRIV